MTTTRVRFRKDDLYYDGIAWGTPAGQIVFKWDGDVLHAYLESKLFASVMEHELDQFIKWLNKQIKKVVE